MDMTNVKKKFGGLILQERERDGTTQSGQKEKGEQREDGEGLIFWVGWKSKHFVKK